MTESIDSLADRIVEHPDSTERIRELATAIKLLSGDDVSEFVQQIVDDAAASGDIVYFEEYIDSPSCLDAEEVDMIFEQLQEYIETAYPDSDPSIVHGTSRDVYEPLGSDYCIGLSVDA